MQINGVDFVEQSESVVEFVKGYATSFSDKEMTVGDIVFFDGDEAAVRDLGGHGFYYFNGIFTRLSLTPYAEGQLLQRLAIPAPYWHRCPLELQKQNVDCWLSKYASKSVLIRFQNDQARAILSTRFTPELDDDKILPQIFESLKIAYKDNLENLHIQSFKKEHDISVTELVFKDAKVNLNGITYYSGVQIVNSEVGRSSVWIRPMILSTDGHTFSDRNAEGCFSIRHTGELVTEKTTTAVAEAHRVSQVGVYRLLQTQNEMVKPLDEVKSLVEKSDFLAMRLVDIVEEEYQNTQYVSRLSLAKSLLLAVQELPLFQKYLAEQEIGRWLGLFENTDERFESIGEDLVAVNQ